MTRRELTERYMGQFLGKAWVFLHPVILLSLYVVVFAVIMKGRLQLGSIETDYPSYILAGLIPWMAIQEAALRGSTAVVSNASLVKQVVFPLEILPIKSVLVAWATQVIGFVFLICYLLFFAPSNSFSPLLLPIALILHVMFSMGLAFLLAAATVFVRDLRDVIQVLLLVGMYSTPVFYPLNAIPQTFSAIFYLNPITYLILCFHDVFVFGHMAHPKAWGISLILSLVTLVIGFKVFRALKNAFGDAL
jgi:lipopolysaccharide transport system permease protein